MKKLSICAVVVLVAGLAFSVQGFAAGMASTDRASEIIGKTVKSPQGQDLGTVEDLVLSPGGQVQYLVLSHGETMGMGGELVPIPWQVADVKAKQESIIINVSEKQLKDAPRIKEGEWSKLFEPGYDKEVNAYYGGKSAEFQKQASEYREKMQRARDANEPLPTGAR